MSGSRARAAPSTARFVSIGLLWLCVCCAAIVAYGFALRPLFVPYYRDTCQRAAGRATTLDDYEWQQDPGWVRAGKGSVWSEGHPAYCLFAGRRVPLTPAQHAEVAGVERVHRWLGVGGALLIILGSLIAALASGRGRKARRPISRHS